MNEVYAQYFDAADGAGALHHSGGASAQGFLGRDRSSSDAVGQDLLMLYKTIVWFFACLAVAVEIDLHHGVGGRPDLVPVFA